MNFFPLEFHTKAYLVGMLAALIPLIIHLSRSRRTKKIRFSTTRFFTDQFLRSYRMSRLREILLLICRMALFALFAMALAQPFWNPKEKPGAVATSGSRSVVLVFDNSGSMGYADGGQTLFDRARGAALNMLDTLKSGDTAGIVLAGRRDPDVGPEVLVAPTDQTADVRQALKRVQLSVAGTNLTEAIARAEVLAAASTADSREVWVFSDLQDSGWEMQTASAPSDPSRVGFVFVSIRPQKAVNRAVTAIQFGAVRPVVGVPFRFRPLISFTGDDATEARVRLYVDDELVSERTVEKLPGGRWAMPSFHHTFKKGGWHHGSIEVDDANLPQDNKRFFALEVLEGVKVLAVNGAPSQVPHLDELFFLRLALTAAPEGQEPPVQVETIAPDAVATAELNKYRVVVLANVESLPEAAVEKLENFVAAGGSLLVTLGDRVSKDFYNETFAGATRRFGGLLPGRLKDVRGNPNAGADTSFIGSVDFRHPALAPFQEIRSGTLIGSGAVALKAYWRVEAPDETVLMQTQPPLSLTDESFRALEADKVPEAVLGKLTPLKDREFDTRAQFLDALGKALGEDTLRDHQDRILHDATSKGGRPLLCEKSFGKGRVVLFTSTADRDWTNFPIRPVFLPWVHLLVAYLAQDPAGQQAFNETGGLVRLPLRDIDPTKPPLVKKPGGGVATLVRGAEGSGVFLFNETEEPGVYTVITPEQKKIAEFAVNLDSYESDLTYLDDVLAADATGSERVSLVEDGLKDLMKRPVVTFVADPAKVADVGAGAGRGRGLWDWFLVIVLLIGLFEPWLANRISVRLYGKPRVPPNVVMPLPPSPDLAAAAPAPVAEVSSR
jgi:hypothetical protein